MSKIFSKVFMIFLLTLSFSSCRKQQLEVQKPQGQNQSENKSENLNAKEANERGFPKDINIYDYALDLPGTYANENIERSSSWFAYYFLGWSKDGKICYIDESYSDGSGIHRADLKVQDLVSDKIIFTLDLFKNETDDSSIALKNAAIEKKQEIQSALKTFEIILQKAQVLKMPIKYEDFLIQAEVLETQNQNEQGLVDFTVNALRSDGRKKRVTGSRDSADFPHEKVAYSANVDFYLQSPYENRAAILIHTVCRGFECNIDEYRFAGCHLDLGFE